MAKPISGTALALIQQKTGTDPFIAVKINWGLEWSWYSTRTIKPNPEIKILRPSYNPNIIKVDAVRSEQNSESKCSVSSVRLTFSDTDGQLKFVIDNRIAEKAPAAIFLGFNSTTEIDFVPLIVGEVVGPVTWDEKERTCSFEIESNLESTNIGYSATRNDYDDMNPEAEGVPWPMIFGTCYQVPALHLKKRPKANLQCALRLHQDQIYDFDSTITDLTLRGNPTVLAYLNNVVDQNFIYVDDSTVFPQNQDIKIIIEDVVFSGQFINNTTFQVSDANSPKYTDILVTDRVPTDSDHANASVLWLDTTNGPVKPIVNQYCLFKAPTGVEWWNYCIRQEDNKCWFRFPFTSAVVPYKEQLMTAGMLIKEVYGINKPGLIYDITTLIDSIKRALRNRLNKNVANPFGMLSDQLDKIVNNAQSWWTVPADVDVKLWEPHTQDVYVASLVKLNSVDAVYGKRRVNVQGRTKTIFAPIPSSYYTVNNANYKINNQTATAILFETPLMEYAGQDWEEDVFVSATSSVGPNPIDILIWLFTSFTSLQYDTVLFSTVRTQLSGVQANFALFDKRDAIKVAQDIAFQCRCGLLFDMGGVGIRLLSHQDAPVAVFDQTNSKNLKIGFVETKELVTRLIVSYTTNYKDKHHLAKTHELNTREIERILKSFLPTDTRGRSETQYVTYEKNVSVYDVKTREENAYIFNDVAQVNTFANFWGFRFSNVWKTVSFDTWLEGTRLQIWDIIYLDYVDPLTLNLAVSPIPVVVLATNFDYSTKVTSVQCLMPVLAGSNHIETGFWTS